VKKLAIVAALEREVGPLVKNWRVTSVTAQKRTIKMFENENVVVACGGIGVVNARIAADAVYRHAGSNIGLFISAGLAGALIPEFAVGEIFSPGFVVDDVDGGRIQTSGGEGTLVTASSIVNAVSKRRLAQKHIARAVDMEAYAVADVARVYSVPFVAVKAISDTLDFAMPPLSRFLNPEGEFNTFGFAVFAAMRPWLWSTVIQLGKNSGFATQRLCRHLQLAIEHYSSTGLYNGTTEFRKVNR
jgi:adenosylhomocysteine nucleosidase